MLQEMVMSWGYFRYDWEKIGCLSHRWVVLKDFVEGRGSNRGKARNFGLNRISTKGSLATWLVLSFNLKLVNSLVERHHFVKVLVAVKLTFIWGLIVKAFGLCCWVNLRDCSDWGTFVSGGVLGRLFICKEGFEIKFLVDYFWSWPHSWLVEVYL